VKIGLFVTSLEKDYNHTSASYWIRILQMIEYYEQLGVAILTTIVIVVLRHLFLLRSEFPLLPVRCLHMVNFQNFTMALFFSKISKTVSMIALLSWKQGAWIQQMFARISAAKIRPKACSAILNLSSKCPKFPGLFSRFIPESDLIIFQDLGHINDVVASVATALLSH